MIKFDKSEIQIAYEEAEKYMRSIKVGTDHPSYALIKDAFIQGRVTAIANFDEVVDHAHQLAVQLQALREDKK